MTTFIHSLLHFAYSLSLFAVLLFVTLNITVPVSLQWPTYCTNACRVGTPLREQCQSFCQLHDDAYSRVRAFTGFSISEMQKLVEKNNPLLTHLISNPPTWFFAVNVILSVCAALSDVFWVSTILSDSLARGLRGPTRVASLLSMLIFAAYGYAVFLHDILDVDDLYRKFAVYSQRERIVLGLLFAYPLLQMLVLWSIPPAEKSARVKRVA